MPKDNDQAVAPGTDESVAPIEDDESQEVEGTDSDEQGNGDVVDYRALYEQRDREFKGLQSTVQQLVEQQRKGQDDGIRGEFEAAQRELAAELEGMTESEQIFARRAFDAEWKLKFIEYQGKKDAPLQAELARDRVIADLMERFPGLSKKFLVDMAKKYNNPYALAGAAEGAYAAHLQHTKPKPGPVESGKRGNRSGGDEAQLEQLNNSGNWEAYWDIVDRQNARGR